MWYHNWYNTLFSPSLLYLTENSTRDSVGEDSVWVQHHLHERWKRQLVCFAILGNLWRRPHLSTIWRHAATCIHPFGPRRLLNVGIPEFWTSVALGWQRHSKRPVLGSGTICWQGVYRQNTSPQLLINNPKWSRLARSCSGMYQLLALEALLNRWILRRFTPEKKFLRTFHFVSWWIDTCVVRYKIRH